MSEKEQIVLKDNPLLIIMLGAGFTMASGADVRAALGMGAAVFLTLVLSSIVISLICRIIPDKIKLPAYVMIITGFVTLIQMLMNAWFPDILDMLGVHVAALAVSAVAIRDAGEIADNCDTGRINRILTAALTGLLLAAVMFVCASVREVFGNASFFGYRIAFLEPYKISALTGAFGGYLVLALVTAFIASVCNKRTEKKERGK